MSKTMVSFILYIMVVSEMMMMMTSIAAAFSFSSSSSSSSTTSLLPSTTGLFSTNKNKGFGSSDEEAAAAATKTTTTTPKTKKLYPSMSRDEVQSMLDTVPVYAVTEPNQEGLVLLKEKNNPNDIAYFFFSPKAATTVFAPLKKEGEWSVSAYPLGLVWFELIDNDPEKSEDGTRGVEYRLLPEPDDLIGAQNLLREQAKQQGTAAAKSSSSSDVNELFRLPYNEVPIFVDQFLRVSTATSAEEAATDAVEEKVPMYIGLKDLMETCNKAIKASSGEYQAAMSVISLKDLIDEMMNTNGNTNDYRKAILAPPSEITKETTSASLSSSSSKTKSKQPSQPEDPFSWEGKQNIIGKKLEEGEEISIPTATNDWSD
jgi:hypothetical protein